MPAWMWRIFGQPCVTARCGEMLCGESRPRPKMMMMMRYSLQCNSGILLEAPLRRIFLHMGAGLLRTCMLQFFFL